jgi:hypothetical protein
MSFLLALFFLPQSPPLKANASNGKSGTTEWKEKQFGYREKYHAQVSPKYPSRVERCLHSC